MLCIIEKYVINMTGSMKRIINHFHTAKRNQHEALILIIPILSTRKNYGDLMDNVMREGCAG